MLSHIWGGNNDGSRGYDDYVATMLCLRTGKTAGSTLRLPAMWGADLCHLRLLSAVHLRLSKTATERGTSSRSAPGSSLACITRRRTPSRIPETTETCLHPIPIFNAAYFI